MKRALRTLAVAAIGFIVAAAAAAQQPQSRRVAGTISAVEGPAIVVKTEDGEVRVNLTDRVAVFGVVSASMADIKPGSFIGVGAMPQLDGSQRAMRVMIFAESQRGTGEGHRPWVHPGSTMTNATVEATVSAADGQAVTVRYRDGEKKLVIPPGLPIQRYVPGDRKELKPGVAIVIVAAIRKPDGSFEASRVNVGRDGVVPN